MEKLRFTVGRPQRLVLFVCTVVAGLFLSAVAALLLGQDTAPRVRIVTVIQDLLGFMVPAVVTAVLVTRRPADLLMIARPRMAVVLLMMLALVAAVPAMNFLVEWNASLPLPEAWHKAGAEQQKMVHLLFGDATAGSLVMALMIIGVMAPLTEEFLFRGCLQRLFGSMMNHHLAVWLAAAVFSLAHFDMGGFFPRWLLGACFGYAMIWSGSVWSSVACHALNNGLAVVAMWLQMRGSAVGTEMQTCGYDSPWLVAGSTAATAMIICMAWRSRVRPSQQRPADTDSGTYM